MMTSLPTISTVSRYRFAFLALSSVAVAYGVYLIRRGDAAPAQGGLHRSNAIRRSGSQRRRREAHNEDIVGVRQLRREEAETALASLGEKEQANSTYGDLPFARILASFDVNLRPTAPTHCALIPSQLLSIEELVQHGLPEPLATKARELIESNFVLIFLSTEIPDRVTIPDEEARYISSQLIRFEISSHVTLGIIASFNRAVTRDTHDRTPLRPLSSLQTTAHSQDGAEARSGPTHTMGNVAEGPSDYGWREGGDATSSTSNGQDMLTLLYHIAEDNTKKENIVHRGVQCNGCSMMPLRGVRYRCANCADYDLCETCESMQIHVKTHVFYKIRIPTPWNTGPKQPTPVWYPGKPHMMPLNPSTELMKKLVEQTGFEHSQLETFWEQFRVIAATEWVEDPDKIGVAIDRKTFDRAFLPGTATRPPPPNLIFDRLFSFYDVNGDGKIGFTEFVQVQACLEGKTRDAKLRRIFFGYDLNSDGFVDRRDFLRMFRAWYALKREYMRDVLGEMQDDAMQNDLRDTLLGSQPISSAFLGTIHPGHDSREGEGKQLHDGDLIIVDNEGILQEDVMDQYDRGTLVHDLEHDRSKTSRDSLYQNLSTRLQADGDTGEDQFSFLGGSDVRWPPPLPFEVTEDDMKTALGAVVPLEEVMDPIDRHRVYSAMLDRWNKETDVKAESAAHRAILNRWHRREFYTDVEEGVTKPMDTGSDLETSNDSDDDLPGQIGSASGSRPLSPRSRSSSKVRFEDSITDTDYETRSNTSQRSIPIGERWGGYEITEAEKDIGKEVLYLAVSEGFNELLDEMFLEKEDAAMRAYKTRKLRSMLTKELQEYEARLNRSQSDSHWNQANTAHGSRPEGKLSGIEQSEGTPNEQPQDPVLASLLGQSGYSIDPSLSSRNIPPEDDHNEITPFPHLDQNPPQTSLPSQEQNAVSLPPLPDPTLPQNRPNSPSVALSLSDPQFTPIPSSSFRQRQFSSIIDQSKAPDGSWNPHIARLSHPYEQVTTLPPGVAPTDDNVLKYLLEDERVDREATERGGHGRINYDEFVQKMVPEGLVGASDEENKVGVGGMKKLGFVGAWIDMAGFF